MIVLKLFGDHFEMNDEGKVKVNFFFGVQEANAEYQEQWESVFMTKPVFDKNFDVSCIECQQYLLDFCDDLQK